MNNNNWPQISALIAAALFGVNPTELDVMHISIIFASLVGAMWALNREPDKTPLASVFFFLRIALTAAVLSVATSKVISGFLPSHVSANGLMPIIAFFIGLIGDDWPKAYKWMTSLFKHKVKERANIKEGKDNDTKL